MHRFIVLLWFPPCGIVSGITVFPCGTLHVSNAVPVPDFQIVEHVKKKLVLSFYGQVSA